MKRKKLTAMLMAVILSLGISGCKSQNAADADITEPTTEVETGFIAEISETQTSVVSETTAHNIMRLEKMILKITMMIQIK